jgi:hypothetical protein
MATTATAANTTTTSSGLFASNSRDGDRQAPTTSTSTGAVQATSAVVATTSKNISIQQAAPNKVGTVKERIHMFGGNEVPKPPPTLVQKRRDQLSTKWEKDATKKVATHGACGRTGNAVKDPRTVEWYTSPNSGIYKKRIAIRSSD